MTFRLHPSPDRLHDILTACLAAGHWTLLEIAVAWAREGGIRDLAESMRVFLCAGNRVKLTVGIDLQGTSREALEALLQLAAAGDIEIFIYHNEAPEQTFHPKIYLFRARDRGRLIVGSNNLTGGGLSTNVEASIDIEAAANSPIIVEAAGALSALRDIADDRIRRLSAEFLQELSDNGYILPEAEIRTRRATQAPTRRPAPGTRTRLFGTVRRRRRDRAPGNVANALEAIVLLLRPRRASETERRTQIQIPVKLKNSLFFDNTGFVVSAHDGREHRFSSATARQRVNTIKLEVPEIGDMNEPVLRMTRRGNRITYEAFPSDSEHGKVIADALRAGLNDDPPSTKATIRDTDRATLYRFV